MLRRILLLSLVLIPIQAGAVINLKMPIFEVSSAAVQLKVTQVNPDNKVLDLAVVEVLFGEFPTPPTKLQIAIPPGLFARIAVGDVVMIFPGKRDVTKGVVHVADHWLLADQNPAKTAWIVKDEFPAMYKSFPGTTASLARLSANRNKEVEPLVEVLHDNYIFTEKPVELGKGPDKTTAICALDLDISGKPVTVLLAETPAGIRAVKVAGGAVADVTTDLGLGGVKGVISAAVGGPKPLLVIDGKAFEYDGKTFGPAANVKDIAVMLKRGPVTYLGTDLARLQPWEEVLSAAVGPFGDQSASGAIVVAPTSITFYPTVPGAPSDFMRLTGQNLTDFEAAKKGLAHPAIRSLDIDGDGRLDALIMADSIGFLLVNRGYGCFFAVEPVTRQLRTQCEAAGVKLGEGVCWTPAHVSSPKFHDIVVLGADGKLIAVPGGVKLPPEGE